MTYDLTNGSIFKNLLRFSIPYLLSCFLQTFYSLADLFIAGRFNGPATTTGISVGSQLTHMLTVVIAGLAMGATVTIGNAIGAKKQKEAGKSIGNTVVIFMIFALVVTALLILLIDPILSVLKTPDEAYSETYSYVLICFIGVPFITAYNVISSIFRGFGDTRSPLMFVAAAGAVNIVLDYILIGPLKMQAAGAALATIISQAISVALSLIFLIKKETGIKVGRQDLRPERYMIRKILSVGLPISLQDGCVQIAFLVITAIANARGLEAAAAVGIVEKIISFLFLVPSAMLSSVSAIGAQNAGAGKDWRSVKTLKSAIIICLIYGAAAVIVCELFPSALVGLFTDESSVAAAGGEYLKTYAFDTLIAGVHFCCCGFFCAYNRAVYSFISNIASITIVRIPGAYLASKFFPDTLFPMGMAAPAGSLLSAVICVCLFVHIKNSCLDLSSDPLRISEGPGRTA